MRMQLHGQRLDFDQLEALFEPFSFNWPKAEAWDAIMDTTGNLRSLQFPLPVYRGLDGIYEAQQLRWKHLGECWSESFDSAQAFGSVILEGTLRSPAQVNWQQTVEARLTFDLLEPGQHMVGGELPEHELRLWPGERPARVDVIKAPWGLLRR